MSTNLHPDQTRYPGRYYGETVAAYNERMPSGDRKGGDRKSYESKGGYGFDQYEFMGPGGGEVPIVRPYEKKSNYQVLFPGQNLSAVRAIGARGPMSEAAKAAAKARGQARAVAVKSFAAQNDITKDTVVGGRPLGGAWYAYAASLYDQSMGKVPGQSRSKEKKTPEQKEQSKAENKARLDFVQSIAKRIAGQPTVVKQSYDRGVYQQAVAAAWKSNEYKQSRFYKGVPKAKKPQTFDQKVYKSQRAIEKFALRQDRKLGVVVPRGVGAMYA